MGRHAKSPPQLAGPNRMAVRKVGAGFAHLTPGFRSPVYHLPATYSQVNHFTCLGLSFLTYSIGGTEARIYPRREEQAATALKSYCRTTVGPCPSPGPLRTLVSSSGKQGDNTFPDELPQPWVSTENVWRRAQSFKRYSCRYLSLSLPSFQLIPIPQNPRPLAPLLPSATSTDVLRPHSIPEQCPGLKSGQVLNQTMGTASLPKPLLPSSQAVTRTP